jgi:serine/threonine-protein kinase HipA
VRLNVFVDGVRVAVLQSLDGFEHELRYEPEASPEQFISLTMPVKNGPIRWPALHPFFHISLPEGFLLALLKERLGPHLGGRPIDLLSVVGHNLIGRVQTSAGDQPRAQDAVIDIAPLLHGERSQRVFLEMMNQFAASGVSGVVPKFLTPDTAPQFRKGTLLTDRFIVKSSSDRDPFTSLNEYLCMEVSRRAGIATANTRLSDDGHVLVVERFDIDPLTGRRKGFEDFCSLLGLSPDQKYDSTWERAARLIRDYVQADRQHASLERLAVTLLLTFALGNADCHAKNLGLLYTSPHDVELAPVFDMLTVLAYDRYADNPPALFIDGRKRWDGMSAVWRFMRQHLNFSPAVQTELVDRVCSATSDVLPELWHHIRHTNGFRDTGLRMVSEWNQGMKRLQPRRSFDLPDWIQQADAKGYARPSPAKRFGATRIGESELLAPRSRKRATRPAS